MLPLDSKQSILQYIEIIPGSVTVHYYALDITADSLIEYTGGKLRFMRLIGIFSLYINDHPVLQEDENMNFTFELALLEAVTAGNIEAVEFLLQLETVNIDHTNEEGKTALMLACKRGHEDIVHSLLSAGANVNIQDNHGQTALMMASTNTFKKSVATYTKPDFMLLNQWLEPLVDWQSFGLLLPGITQWNIITIQQLNAKHQKLALFTKWLNTDPTATWRDVLNALTKREEINLLQTINDQLQVHQCTRGREVDESNKSSIQSSESEKEESKKKMTKAMQMEIDHLRSSLQSKA
uniref:Death domain-containing protein n=1 Tax=Amphimedon queenslandica TaxID=400682 RepID=A0A1X7T627_AMPQE